MPARSLAPASTLMPGSEPAALIMSTKRRAVLRLLADRLVEEDDAGDVVLHRLVGAEQHLAVVAADSSVDSSAIESKRFLIVPVLSSAARMPLPSATMRIAMSSSLSLMAALLQSSGVSRWWFRALRRSRSNRRAASGASSCRRWRATPGSRRSARSGRSRRARRS